MTKWVIEKLVEEYEGSCLWVEICHTVRPDLAKGEKDRLEAQDQEDSEYRIVKVPDEQIESVSLEEKLVDRLAKKEHEQWCSWSKAISEQEFITEERIQRWERLWETEWEELSEEEKKSDMKWAKRVLKEFPGELG